jgi:hypothetical protein
MKEKQHRGWRIRYHCTGEWLAEVYRPGSLRAESELSVATVEEGEDALLQRARQKIDELIRASRAG